MAEFVEYVYNVFARGQTETELTTLLIEVRCVFIVTNDKEWISLKIKQNTHRECKYNNIIVNIGLDFDFIPV